MHLSAQVHVLYGHSMEAAHFTNVCGSPVFWASCVCGEVADGKQPSFASVCVSGRVCVWCGQRLKREPRFTWEQMTGSGFSELYL